jgi:hypothetical protein
VTGAVAERGPDVCIREHDVAVQRAQKTRWITSSGHMPSEPATRGGGSFHSRTLGARHAPELGSSTDP